MDIEVKVNQVYLPIMKDKNRFKVLYGGAGSGKSHFVAQWLILKCLKEKNRRFLVVRKVARTLRYTVFMLIREIISEMELSGLFQINKTDMTITCINGNQFLFLGLDDVEKLKSIVGVTDIWIEEASELLQTDLEQLNLRLRGNPGIQKQIILTFNPIAVTHWLKKYFFDVKKDDAIILKTTYKDNKFLDDEYIKQLESLKDRDYVYYQVYALGEWGLLGNQIYTNYIIENIPTNDDNYKAIYYGLDFGFNDPSAFIKVGIKDQELYILDEFYRSQLTNTDLIREVKPMYNSKDWVIADSAEPDRIKEFRRAGFRIRSCTKSKNSVKFGIDWIKRRKIHIHPSCQNFINEIQTYKYREDKDGNILDEPVDANNHLMDAMRYATEIARVERTGVIPKPSGW